MVSGQEEAKNALVHAASVRHAGKGRVLLLGPSRSARHFIARALAHALEAPFATGDARFLGKREDGSADFAPLLVSLLQACDFDVELAEPASCTWRD